MTGDNTVKNKFIQKLKHKYRIVFLNDSTFEKVGFLKLTKLKVLAVGGIFVIIFIAMVWSVIAYTPIRELIPGYPDAELRNSIIQNKIRLDSLELEINYRDQYFNNLKAVIAGERTEDFIAEQEATTRIIENNENTRNPENDQLTQEAILTEKLNLPGFLNERNSAKLEHIFFFSPVRGMVTNSFNPLDNHFGTDIVAGPNEVVKATLKGTVTWVAWTLETGHVIQIQHENNLISVYKHNAEILKKVGMRVKAGDAIAIIGNSGELTTGPHLHFEIWQNGIPLDPENFIVF